MMDRYDYSTWLNDLKLMLSFSLSDKSRDELLLNYLEIAHKNLWECYYRRNDWNDETIVNDPYFKDGVTKMATLHLTVTLFSNPDENLEATNVRDDRMLMRILGSRMVY